MKDTIKRYMPYAIITFLIYIIIPLVFSNEALAKFAGVELYFIFPITAIVGAAIYSAKYGLDFLFSLIAPILFLPTMFLFCGGFAGQYALHNILLIVIYLVASMFGLFIGDIAFGDERRQREKAEQKEAEEMMLEAKRRDEKFLRNQSQKIQKKSDISASESEIDDILNEFNKLNKH